jgi:ERCC4-type nuclease
MGFEEKVARAVKAVASIPGITPEQADLLVHRGFLSLEDLLQAEAADFEEIAEIGPQAASIFEAVRAEAARRNPEGAPTPVA